MNWSARRASAAHGLVLRAFGGSLLALLRDDGVIDPSLDQAGAGDV
jgi:hypothetical protein